MNKGKEIRVSSSFSGLRLDKFIVRNFENCNIAICQKFIRNKKILVNGEKANLNSRVAEADIVFVSNDLINLHFNDRKISKQPKIIGKAKKEELSKFFKSLIIEEHEDFIAINKPHGLAVQGGSKIKKSVDSILKILNESGNGYRLVHRLDKDTSGILIIAKSEQAAANLTALFKNRDIKKTYRALVVGKLPGLSGKIELKLAKKGSDFERVEVDEKEGSEAVTFYKQLRVEKNKTLVELNPVTGRKHQLRVHMATIGCPIFGDKKYGKEFIDMKDFNEKLCLTAWAIEFMYNDKKVKITL